MQGCSLSLWCWAHRRRPSQSQRSCRARQCCTIQSGQRAWPVRFAAACVPCRNKRRMRREYCCWSAINLRCTKNICGPCWPRIGQSQRRWSPRTTQASTVFRSWCRVLCFRRWRGCVGIAARVRCWRKGNTPELRFHCIGESVTSTVQKIFPVCRCRDESGQQQGSDYCAAGAVLAWEGWKISNRVFHTTSRPGSTVTMPVSSPLHSEPNGSA